MRAGLASFALIPMRRAAMLAAFDFMTTRDPRQIVTRHIQRLRLPARLDGVRVQITVYDDEDTLRFMKNDEPDITLESQNAINAEFAKQMRRRGAEIQFVPVDIADYFAWLGRYQLQNVPANRAQYISWLTAPDPKPTPISP
jgi:hypothetical protein